MLAKNRVDCKMDVDFRLLAQTIEVGVDGLECKVKIAGLKQVPRYIPGWC